MTKQKTFKNRVFRTLIACTFVGVGLAGVVAGCGSGSGDLGSAQSGLTGTFFGPEPPIFNGPSGPSRLGRSFVTLDRGVPQSVGFELYRTGRDNQPPTAITDEGPNVYFIPLPPEASVTAFKQMALFYFTGHPIDQYRPEQEPEHFHAVFLLNPPQQPSPGFVNELQYPVAEEVPPTVTRGVPDTVVPGVGVSYDIPNKPVGQPARITIGQNFLYYNAHMNGMVVGTNVRKAFDSPTGLVEPDQFETDLIPQPAVYPKPGWYPRRWIIRNDTARNVNVFEMTDFIYVGPEKSRKKTAE
ncbi:MAG: hypothetical protein SFU56_20460 [Capsulimonadales bacterium]|nr:hypothetical protein [Capsulimonadales bacterium]